mgnify:CR=1 FL=1
MSKWFSGSELTERWGIPGFELFNYIIKGLQPYDRETGQPVPSPEIQSKMKELRYSRDLLKKGFLGEKNPAIILAIKHLRRSKEENRIFEALERWDRRSQREILKKRIKTLENEIYVAGDTWKGYCQPDPKKERLRLVSEVLKYIYKSDDVENVEKLYNLAQKESIETDQIGLPETKKALRPNQRHKNDVREVATALWQSNPKLTIPEIANKGEIESACEGKRYAEKTIRKWIKDLTPNPSAGRRKGT